jgi:hypothetical protein
VFLLDGDNCGGGVAGDDVGIILGSTAKASLLSAILYVSARIKIVITRILEAIIVFILSYSILFLLEILNDFLYYSKSQVVL